MFESFKSAIRETMQFLVSLPVDLFHKDGKLTFRYKYLIKITPFFNLLYDLFFSGLPPKPESAKSLLDVMGLFNALLMTTVASLMTSVSRSDLILADNLYMPSAGNASYVAPPGGEVGYAKYWSTYYTLPPSTQLYYDISNSLSLLFLGILTVVYVYTDMLSKNGSIQESISGKYIEEEIGNNQKNKSLEESAAEEVVEDHQEASENEACFAVWWAYAKYTLFVVVGTTLVGSVFCVLAGNVILAIKYPDYYLEEYGEISDNIKCPTGYSNYFFKSAFGIVAVVTSFACGFGTAAKYRRKELIRVQRAIKQAKDDDSRFGDKVKYTEKPLAGTENGCLIEIDGKPIATKHNGKVVPLAWSDD